MQISILTVFKKLYKPFLETSLIKNAIKKDLIKFDISEFFEESEKNKRIDDSTFGHGTGMLIKPEITEKLIEKSDKKYGKSYKILFSPHGQILTQSLLKKIYKSIKSQSPKHLMLIAGRYEGMDARVEEHYADNIISLGNFVLMGGDLPAMMFTESLLRLIPGVVGKEESVEKDSFSYGLTDYPEYTKPVTWKNKTVPEIVRSGNHKELANWRENQAIKRTVYEHFHWMRNHTLNKSQKEKALACIPAHFAVLMHTDVILPNNPSGTTSVTSTDIHDIARSAKTYGFKMVFIVTPLLDQQKIINYLTNFWLSEKGEKHNQSRQEAIKLIKVTSSLKEAIEKIKETEEKEPILMGTSARIDEYNQHANPIKYTDQNQIWKKKSPVAVIFGTGHGLSKKLIKTCNFMLPPLEGLTEFNHLSVRSAAAIIMDRWMGK